MHRPNRRNSRRYGRLGPVALLGLALAACSGEGPQSSLTPASPDADDIDSLFTLTLVIAGVILVGVTVALVYSMIRFRKRKDDDGSLPKQVHGNSRLEIAWTIAPALILAGIAVPTVQTIFDIAEEPENALELNVVGHQWWWEFEYTNLQEFGPGTVITANELHIPVDRPVYLTMTAENTDVIHSFWVPPLAGKRDVVPGITPNNLTLEADEPGLYYGQCAEFCGLAHADMRMRVFADEPADFQAWVDAQQAPAAIPPDDGSLRAEGWSLFLERGCSACHVINDTEADTVIDRPNPGPNLTHFGGRTTFASATWDSTPELLNQWLADPNSLKPMEPELNRGMPNLGLSDEEVTALVAFLVGLE